MNLYFKLIVIIFTAFLLSACGDQDYPNAESDKYRLVWNDDPSSTITVIWDQLKGSNAKVCYGKEDNGRDYKDYPLMQEPTRKLLNYYGMNTYYAEIKNLEPDENYHFVIKDEFGVSNKYYFKTAPNKPPAPRKFCGEGLTNFRQ